MPRDDRGEEVTREPPRSQEPGTGPQQEKQHLHYYCVCVSTECGYAAESRARGSKVHLCQCAIDEKNAFESQFRTFFY